MASITPPTPPWGVLGPLRDQFQRRLDEELEAAQEGQHTIYLEISCYIKRQGVDRPDAEFRVTGGNVGLQLFEDEATIEEVEEGSEIGDGLPLVSELLNDMVEQLKVKLVEVQPGGYEFIPGIHVYLATSSGIESGDSADSASDCPVGTACVWREAKQAMWWKQIWIQNGQCRRQWISPC